MARTHFTGPITAGSIRDTSGTTVGTNVKNAGYVVMTQVSPITQTNVATATSIVIPANSLIIGGTSYAIVDFTTGTEYTLGTTVAANEIADSIACSNGTTNIAANNDIQSNNWANVGPKDVQIYYKAGTNGAGKGILSISYAQAVNYEV
jgi:hypothetical protein